MKPKIIHTKKFSCADDHAIVYYTVDENILCQMHEDFDVNDG